MATQWRLGKLRGCICAAAIGTLAGCTTSPMTFDFKWFENDPGFTWLQECTGEPRRRVPGSLGASRSSTNASPGG